MSELVRGRYQVIGVVGRGGQGDVVRALDTQHDRQVAMKVRRVGSAADRGALLKEARILLGLRPHPNLPLVREDFFEGDLYYVVMDWIEGKSLAEVLEARGTSLPIAEVLADLRPVAEALDHLHGHDPPVIHKDVKPGNVIKREGGRVVLVDFGLSSPDANGIPGYSGTPGFVAPELATAGVPTAAADVYGLAATAFALLAGRAPDGTLPDWEGLPAGKVAPVQACLRRGLSIDPHRRQTTATGFVDDLARAAGLEVRSPRRIRPRTAVAGALLGAVVVAVPFALVLLAPHGPNVASASVPADAVSAIDLGTLRATAGVGLGGRPGALAVGEGTAWVIDAASGEVLRVDPVTGSIAAHIAVGNGPTGIAAGGGSIWVTNQDDRSVSRIDPATNTVSQRIIVGNAPTGIAVGEGAVWVVNSLDDTVVHLDLGSGARQGTPIGVGERPAGIAVGLGSVWVTDEATGRVSRISPTSDQVIETIPVGRGPVGITVGDTAVWVANRVDLTVSRIDPVTGSVTTSDIGADPATLVADGDDVWVADEAGGRLLRIDPTTHIVASIVDLGNPPRALGIDGRTLYTTTRSPAAAHRGGTLVVVSSRTVDDMDPAISGWTNPDSLMAATYYLTGDTLVAYRHVGGSAGTTLVPDLAQSVPDPADAGRSYTFRIQPGLTFSDGTPVSPSDVRRTFERAYTVSEGQASGLGPPTLTGVERCSPDGCDLSEGIVTDATAGTVTFRLTAPDPDFLYRVANPLFTIVPASTPDPFIAGPGGSQVLGVGGPIPGTGPYRVAQVDVGHQRIVLERNPRFHVWSSDARPDGYPDSIELDGGLDPFDQVAMIDGGDADALEGPIQDPNLAARITTAQQHHIVFPTTQYVFMNTTKAPFDDVRVRQAVNYALDRRAMTTLVGGLGQDPTCQVLPPGIPGYEPYCPYTNEPASGQWTAPDPAKAQQLVDASGTKESAITVWTSGMDGAANEPAGQELVRALSALGYRASLNVGLPYFGGYAGQVSDPATHAQIGLWRWGVDFAQPSDFFAQLFTCDAIGAGLNAAQLCDPELDAMIGQAQELQSHDRAGANVLWAAIDRAVVDKAPWVPYGNQGATDLVSARTGDYQYNTMLGTLFDQLWVH